MGREFLDPISLRRLVYHIKSEFSKYAKSTEIPTKVSELENDSGYITEVPEIEFVETDPTVPEWAKQSNKPTYTADEVGAYPTSEIDSQMKNVNKHIDQNETLIVGLRDEIDIRLYDLETTVSSKASKATTLEGYGIADAYTKTEIDTRIGDIDTALDNIIAIQNELMGVSE